MRSAVVDESSEILGYLERTYPTPELYPSDPEQRKEVERWTVLQLRLGSGLTRTDYA